MTDDNPFTSQGEAQTSRKGFGRINRPSLRSLDPDFQEIQSGNPFEAVANAQMNGAQKAKHRVAAKAEARREEKLKPPTAMELKRIEDAALAKMYRAWKREERAAMVEKHGKDMKELVSLLRGLNASSFDDLEAYVRGSKWPRADEKTRYFVLGAIDASMFRASIRDGRPPINDPLWDEPPSPWLKIKKHLTGIGNF